LRRNVFTLAKSDELSVFGSEAERHQREGHDLLGAVEHVGAALGVPLAGAPRRSRASSWDGR